MIVHRDYRGLPATVRGMVLAIGNFDGVHRGHQIVIGEARAVADAIAAPLGAMAFEPHPRQLFRPHDPPFRLTPFEERARLFQALGVDVHIVPQFDQAFSELSAEAFIEDILVGELGVRHVAIGYDFCFGNKRRGTAEVLVAAGRHNGFGVTIVTQAADEVGGVYSSSSVRERLRAADPRGAAAILGRPWEIAGTVVKGDQRGRLLGYPTANVKLGDYLRPALGVYAVRAGVASASGQVSRWFDGVANLGIRPMFAVDTPLLEAFLFDFNGDLYGARLRVQLVEFLRPEAKFDGVEALKAQMDRDSAEARLALDTGARTRPDQVPIEPER